MSELVWRILIRYIFLDIKFYIINELFLEFLIWFFGDF